MDKRRITIVLEESEYEYLRERAYNERTSITQLIKEFVNEARGGGAVPLRAKEVAKAAKKERPVINGVPAIRDENGNRYD